MNKKVFIVKSLHSLVFWFQVACLSYLLYAGIARDISLYLIIPIVAILINGLLLLLNEGRCPFTNLAEKYGAQKGSVTDIFLPDVIARNIFRVSTPLFIIEILVIGIRFFAGI